MVLNAAGSEASTSGAASRTVFAQSNTNSSSSSKSQAASRRRRSKGTIAGFASGKSSDSASAGSSNAPLENGETTSPGDHASTVSGSSTTGGTQPQHSGGGDSAAPTKPSHAARLALMCCQNAIRMGARTQLGLCPPGRARRTLKAALRQKTTGRNSRIASRNKPQAPPTDVGGYFGVDKMLGTDALDQYTAQEEDFLIGTNTFDAESDEEASSGDDDEMKDLDALMMDDSPALDDEAKYETLDEPLFTPLGAEYSGGGGAMNSAMGTGKLPFNRRKLRYFDSISASDTMAAREYLTTELRKSKQREIAMLAKHLKQAQKKERRRIKEERGIPLSANDLSDNEDSLNDSVLSSVSRFDQAMIPSTAAALILESLSIASLESIEGMAECYNGIVAAGVALLESTVNDPTSPSNENDRRGGTRTEIMTALTPLLITSLEQPAGDVILSLARLRRMCGTARYQRRFVQRVAPALVRPPKAAMWCLRHQNDMEPIVAATELIFDCASEIFSKGWYDRGQLLLADSKRAETLNAAAMQLKNLRTGPGGGDVISLGNSLAGHAGWRHARVHKDGTKSGNEALAEWEVIAVDRQIRVSISNIMSMDWTKPLVQNRDAELARSIHRSSRTASRRYQSITHASSSSGGTSPKTSTPLSPSRHPGSKTSSPATKLTTFEKSEPSPFTPSFTSNDASEPRPKSPAPQPPHVPIQHPPLSPPPPIRALSIEAESRLDDPFSAPSGIPKSPKRPDVEGSSGPQSKKSPSSPNVRPAPPIKESISGPSISSPSPPPPEKQTAISPSAMSTTDSVPSRYMSSVSSSAGSTLPGTMGTQPAHYRMLTSTAAERRRTVAACRALRAQITRFEDAFKELHGRQPKGAAERAPLATTYAQYREWKRAIRADAACRIQALFRGASVRWRLLRSKDPRISRVILSRAGQSGLQPQVQESVIKQLSIPAEIGQPVSKANNDFVKSVGPIGPDGFPTQSPNVQPIAPQWSNQVARRRSGGTSDTFAATAPVPRPASSPPGGSSVSSTGSGEFSRLSLSELQARKRDLKQQLKQYDMSFARRHGRMPVKAEKEPIRHLYERYNALKSQITTMEQESGRSTGSSSPVAMQTAPNVLPQRTMSPVAASMSSGEEESPRPNRTSTPAQHSTAAASQASVPSPPSSQDLDSLKAEKQRLHQMLRAYERDFFREHKRQVSSFADIRPVASNYRRYKEIKKAIAAIVQQGSSS